MNQTCKERDDAIRSRERKVGDHAFHVGFVIVNDADGMLALDCGIFSEKLQKEVAGDQANFGFSQGGVCYVDDVARQTVDITHESAGQN